MLINTILIFQFTFDNNRIIFLLNTMFNSLNKKLNLIKFYKLCNKKKLLR